jgi:hypothetical protein
MEWEWSSLLATGTEWTNSILRAVNSAGPHTLLQIAFVSFFSSAFPLTHCTLLIAFPCILAFHRLRFLIILRPSHSLFVVGIAFHFRINFCII